MLAIVSIIYPPNFTTAAPCMVSPIDNGVWPSINLTGGWRCGTKPCDKILEIIGITSTLVSLRLVEYRAQFIGQTYCPTAEIDEVVRYQDVLTTQIRKDIAGIMHPTPLGRRRPFRVIVNTVAQAILHC
jgi:hypothetical protein